MKKRSAEIARRLVDAPERQLRIESLTADYHISEKTLHADVQEISSYLQGCGFQAVDGGVKAALSITKHHIELSRDVPRAELIDRLDAMDLYDYKLSLDERKQLIAVELLALGEEEYQSMQRLADEMCVTRNTVVGDCKVVAEYLDGYGIKFVSRGKLGIRAEASAEQARSLYIDLFAELLGNSHHEGSFFAGLIAGRLGYRFDFNQIVRCMRMYLRKHNAVISRGAEGEIAACITVMLNERGVDAPAPTEGDGGDSELDLAGSMVRVIAAEVGAPILSLGEIKAIEQMIFARDLLPQIKSFDDFELYCAISHFLLLVGKELDISIQNDSLLIESLLSHIKSVMEWDSDSFVCNITGPSGIMVDMVQAASQPHFHVLEDYLHRAMDESMRASIVIHICAALYRIEGAMNPCRVVVACPGSMATSKYLEAQVRNYFKLEVIGTCMVADLSDEWLAKRDVDFVIATVPISGLETPVVVASPLLTLDDINRIQAQAFKQGRLVLARADQGDSSLIERLCSIYTLGNQRKVDYLNRELRRVLKEVDRIEGEVSRTSPLMLMLSKRFIRLEGGPLEWRDAMRLASEELVRNGFFAQGYVDRAIQNVEEYGSYIIVNQGIALAHAGHNDGVFKDGLGLLVTRDGVEFDDGDPVYLLFFFSQCGETDYLDLFKEIIQLGNDQEGIGRLRAAKTVEDVYQLLIEMLTDYSGPDS